MTTSASIRRAVAVAVAVIAACGVGGCATAARPQPGDAAPVAAGKPKSAAPVPPAPAVPALAALAAVEPVVLAAPEFGREAAVVSDAGGLSIVSQEPNAITDTDAWFQDNQLPTTSRTAEEAPGDVPRTYAGRPLASVLTTPEADFALYGEAFAPSLLVAVTPGTRRVKYAFDFARYAMAPEFAAADREFVQQSIKWARQVGNVLYLSHAHSTYARSSRGMNAYLTAVDVDSGAVLWRSAPLVSNTNDFEIVGDRIVTGYGFTGEPDWLYVLDLGTGATAGGIRLESGPEHIRAKGDSLLVRSYDVNYVVALQP